LSLLRLCDNIFLSPDGGHVADVSGRQLFWSDAIESHLQLAIKLSGLSIPFLDLRGPVYHGAFLDLGEVLFAPCPSPTRDRRLREKVRAWIGSVGAKTVHRAGFTLGERLLRELPRQLPQ
jgi:hypothetical protein